MVDIGAIARSCGYLARPIIGIVTGITAWLFRRWRDRLQVRRILTSTDPDLVGLIDLHNLLFKSDNSIQDEDGRSDIGDSGDDFSRWIEELQEIRKQRVLLDEFFLVAKIGNAVCAYLYATYYVDTNFLFISYIGSDPKNANARWRAPIALLTYLHDQIRKTYRLWNGLVVEVQKSKSKHTKRLFENYQNKIKIKGYEFDLSYLQPPIAPNDIFKPIEEDLLFFPSKKWPPLKDYEYPERMYYEKGLVLTILRFIYLQVYADSFSEAGVEEDTKYRQILLSLYKNYDIELPLMVAATEIKRFDRRSLVRPRVAGVEERSKR
jgi:hypothetical protein